MLIKPSRPWDMRESAIAPESAYLNRRQLMRAAGFAGAAALLPSLASAPVAAQEADPSSGLYPLKRNPAYSLGDRPVTPEEINSNHNNFYEFGSSKRVAEAAQALKIRPWMVKIDGMVEKPIEIGFDDLLKAMPLEERAYRHRCVEAWSMAIHWGGFPLKALMDYAKPLGSAKYVVFQSFNDAEIAPGQKQTWFPWPYTEGVTIAEAANPLSFMVTGAYGKPMAKQFGAPLRLAVPWKYGFKHAKSINRIMFTDQKPVSFWEKLQASEYGFWANVNPEVPHPRWSQATETDLATGNRIPSQLFNGYGDAVAGLYAGMEKDNIWM
jgi:methionine sulfoxide reductase catalytic subunit